MSTTLHPHTELRALPAAAYAEWFDAHRDGLRMRSPFHEPAWLDAVARGSGFDLRVVGAYRDGAVVAAVPGFCTRRGPFRLFGSPLRGLMTSYLGPVSADPAFDLARQRALAASCVPFVRRHWGVSYAAFTFRDAPGERIPPPGPSWHEKRAGSYRLDLTPGEDKLFANLKSHCRRNVRKATREGVTIEPQYDPEVFYRILQDTFRRHGSASWHPAHFFSGLMTDLVPRDLLWSWGARYEGKVIAAGLFFHDDREMHFISGASLGGYGSLPTSYLLHWHAIATATRAGLRVFNSEASRIPSIDHFKETFNPQRESRSTLTWAPRPAWQAQRAYRAWNKHVRQIRSRLPVG